MTLYYFWDPYHGQSVVAMRQRMEECFPPYRVREAWVPLEYLQTSSTPQTLSLYGAKVVKLQADFHHSFGTGLEHLDHTRVRLQEFCKSRSAPIDFPRKRINVKHIILSHGVPDEFYCQHCDGWHGERCSPR